MNLFLPDGSGCLYFYLHTGFKSGPFLIRLLDSIELQTYRWFEVVVSDDNPDNEVSTIMPFITPN